ncbi:hypothetical protein [Maricaulis sp. CAU 1757]
MLRTFTALTLAPLAVGGALAAQPVAIEPITLGPELLAKADEYGQRELDTLARMTHRALESELAEYSMPGYRLQVTLLDADPNHPTMAQLAAEPSLSLQSFSIGGAELEGTLYAADGSVVGTYHYEWETPSIEQAAGSSRWGDARRAIWAFADDIGDSLEQPRRPGM